MYKIIQHGVTIFKSRSWSEATERLAQIEAQSTTIKPDAIRFVLVAE